MKVKTIYYFRAQKLKVNRSMDANRAVGTCVLHMQINQYGATLAQVMDADTEELHAEVRRHMSGKIEITYRRDPRDFETRFAFEALLKD